MIPLTTARLSLRPFADTDLEFVREVHTRPALMRFIPAAYTPDDNAARRILQRFMTLRDHPQQGFSLVELRGGPDAGTPVALILVKPIPPSGGGEPKDVEIGWRQAPAHCGNGYVTEAAQAVLEALLDAGMPRVVAVTHPDNLPSQAVARHIGMERVGLTDAYYDTETLLFRAAPLTLTEAQQDSRVSAN